MATKKSVWVLFGIVVITGLILMSFTPVAAQMRTFKVFNYITKMESIPVGDVEGHFIGCMERRGTSYWDNGEISTMSAVSSLDVVKGKGTWQGYAIQTFEDGSTIVTYMNGTTELGPKGLPVNKGTGEIFKGTGRFEGVKGTSTVIGKRLTPFSKETKGDTYWDVTITYTVPPKQF